MTECISAPSAFASAVDEFEGMSSLEPSPIVWGLAIKNLQQLMHYKLFWFCFGFFSSCWGKKNNSTHFCFNWKKTQLSWNYYNRIKFHKGKKKSLLLSSFQNKQRFNWATFTFALKCTSAICPHSTEPFVKQVFLCCITLSFVSLLPVSVESAVAVAETCHTAVSWYSKLFQWIWSVATSVEPELSSS